jgi:hypothetical protein
VKEHEAPEIRYQNRILSILKAEIFTIELPHTARHVILFNFSIFTFTVLLHKKETVKMKAAEGRVPLNHTQNFDSASMLHLPRGAGTLGKIWSA